MTKPATKMSLKPKRVNTALPPTNRGIGFGGWFKRILLIVIACFVAFHVIVAALLVVWKTQPINNSMFMILYRLGNFAPVSQTWVDDNQISVNVKRAAIASVIDKVGIFAGNRIEQEGIFPNSRSKRSNLV